MRMFTAIQEIGSQVRAVSRGVIDFFFKDFFFKWLPYSEKTKRSKDRASRGSRS